MPDEVDQYEPFIIREAVNDSIAHQDYTKGGGFNICEMEGSTGFHKSRQLHLRVCRKSASEKMPPKSITVTIFGHGDVQFEDGDTAGGGIQKNLQLSENQISLCLSMTCQRKGCKSWVSARF